MSHGTEVKVELTGGLLHDWQRRNREATIPHAIAELRKAGNLENLRRLATIIVKPRGLPRMDFSKGIPPDCRTLVVVPTLLSRPSGVETLLAGSAAMVSV